MANFFRWLFELWYPPKPVIKPEVKEIELGSQKVFIRSLTAGYALSLQGKDIGNTQIFEVLSRSICDKDGRSLLTPAQAEELGLTTVNQLVKEVMSFNSMSAGAVSIAADELKKTDGLTSNSAAS